MSLVSIEFITFLLCVTVIYYLMPKKQQWIAVLGANLYFYLSAGGTALLYLVFTAVTAWYTAIHLEGINDKFKKLRENCDTREDKQANRTLCTRSKKRTMLLALGINFGIWIALKYSLFAVTNLNLLAEKLHIPVLPLPQWVLPFGISFYTFTAMGYCVDVYRGKYKAERSFFKFFTFISFFAHMVQGPFSRYDVLSVTLFEEHRFSFERLKQGGLRILWGMFKKLVIADRIAVTVNTIYSDTVEYNGMYIWIAMLLFTLELYADFSGYMDIAAGASGILGIRLQENFKQPFFAQSIEEFWRRWHVTLGAWFRDYLFYSVSMSKRVQTLGRNSRKLLGSKTARLIPSYIALFFVWSATGLWHGADWTYLVWGWMNLVIIMLSMQMDGVYQKIRERLHIRPQTKWFMIFRMVRTWMLFSFMELFSEAPSIGAACSMCRSMLTFEHWTYVKEPLSLLPMMQWEDVLIVGAGLVMMLAVDVMKERTKGVFAVLSGLPCGIRYIGYGLIFYGIIIAGVIGGEMSGGFMYAQF